MAKVDDDILIIGGILGGVVLLSLFTKLPGPGPTTIQPKKKNTIHGADGVGAMWVNQHMDGLVASFHLGRIQKSNLRGSIAFGDGMYEEDNQKISAEIIMLLPPFGKTIDITEGAGITEFNKRGLRPNFDYLKLKRLEGENEL